MHCTIFTGVNIESAAYGATLCAERAALGNAISTGHKKGELVAIAIYSPNGGDISPCGVCRQLLYEFEDGQNMIVIFKHNDKTITSTIAELLPFGFNENNLK